MKNKKTILIMCFVVTILLVGLVRSQVSLPEGVKPIQTCKTENWVEEKQVIGTCTRPGQTTVCDDEPLNTSCREITIDVPYACYKEPIRQEKSKEVCETTAYTVNNAVKLYIDGYACTPLQSGDEVVVECDSKHDGNGDGICKPGESCMKFVINGNQIQTYEKNSRYDYLQTDDSFHLERVTMEALQ